MRRVLVLLILLTTPFAAASDLNASILLYMGFPTNTTPSDLTNNWTINLYPNPDYTTNPACTVSANDHMANASAGIENFDMGDNFTVCDYFNQTEYGSSLVSTYGDNFDRTGGAFELFVNNYDNNNPQFGVLLDDGTNLIEIDTINMTDDMGSMCNMTTFMNSFHFVCATYDGGNTTDSLKLYHGGMQSRNTWNLTIGAYPGGYNRTHELTVGAGDPNGTYGFPCGKQDDVIVYKNRILNESEIMDLYMNVSAGVDYPFP